MSEFTADVRLTDIAVRDTAIADALGEPARAMILDALADDSLFTVEPVAD